MTDQTTVHAVTYDLLRTLGLTTVFGNPGSTEQTFLQDFPDDFTYVLALQEASALAMADGFAQSVGRPALVNLHTAAGVGNAMGSLVAAYRANTPLIVTAGQQTGEMSLCDPYLNNREATVLPTRIMNAPRGESVTSREKMRERIQLIGPGLSEFSLAGLTGRRRKSERARRIGGKSNVLK